jgi:hypothetical protein
MGDEIDGIVGLNDAWLGKLLIKISAFNQLVSDVQIATV